MAYEWREHKEETQELLDVVEESIDFTLDKGRITNLRMEDGAFVADYNHEVPPDDIRLRDVLRDSLKTK